MINIPSDNWSSTLSYSIKDFKNFKENNLSFTAFYVFQRRDILLEQDFVEAPDDYLLLGIQAGTKWQIGEQAIHFSIQVDNLLNKTYRDYLNRLRYFADDEGRNIRMNIRYTF